MQIVNKTINGSDCFLSWKIKQTWKLFESFMVAWIAHKQTRSSGKIPQVETEKKDRIKGSWNVILLFWLLQTWLNMDITMKSTVELCVVEDVLF